MTLNELAARGAQLTPKKIHAVLPLMLLAMLYWVSSIPGTPTHDIPTLHALFYWITPSAQNALHVPAYAVLSWAWHWAFGAWPRVSSWRVIAACVSASAYGVFDEWHQSFVPGRDASSTDVVLDVAGAAIGVALAAWVNRYLASRTAALGARDPLVRRT